MNQRTVFGTGHFHMPIHIRAEELATALREHSVADALDPFRKALDQLAASKPAFDQLLEAARKQ